MAFFFAMTLFINSSLIGNQYMGSFRVMLSTSQFWFTLFLVLAILILPTVANRFYHVDVHPTLSDKCRYKQRVLRARAKAPVEVSTRRRSSIRRQRRSIRSGYAFSHQEGFGRLITSGKIMKKVKSGAQLPPEGVHGHYASVTGQSVAASSGRGRPQDNGRGHSGSYYPDSGSFSTYSNRGGGHAGSGTGAALLDPNALYAQHAAHRSRSRSPSGPRTHSNSRSQSQINSSIQAATSSHARTSYAGDSFSRHNSRSHQPRPKSRTHSGHSHRSRSPDEVSEPVPLNTITANTLPGRGMSKANNMVGANMSRIQGRAAAAAAAYGQTNSGARRVSPIPNAVATIDI